MPHMMIRDVRCFKDAIASAEKLLGRMIEWLSENQAVRVAFENAAVMLEHSDIHVKLIFDFAPGMKPSGGWWEQFKTEMTQYMDTRPDLEEIVSDNEILSRYTWSYTNPREQLSVITIFREATDGYPADEDGSELEPEGIQDDPDGVGGSSRNKK